MKYPFFCRSIGRHSGMTWFRIWGYGLFFKHYKTEKELIFSQRKGIRGIKVFGKYYIEILKP